MSKYADTSCYMYSITNLVNGKMYIGISTNPKRRFVCHGSLNESKKMAIARAIRKHGKKNFKMNVLLNASRTYCEDMEKKAIISFNSSVPYGYNISKGGEGCVLPSSESAEIKRKKISEAMKGRSKSEDHKRKISFSLQGRSLPEQTKLKLSKSLKCRVMTEEHKNKISSALSGVPKVFTENKKLGEIKHSETLRKQWKDPAFREMMMAARRKKVADYE